MLSLSGGVKNRNTIHQVESRHIYQAAGLFRRHLGIVGLCPAWGSEGDIVIAALGCTAPLVLLATSGINITWRRVLCNGI